MILTKFGLVLGSLSVCVTSYTTVNVTTPESAPDEPPWKPCHKSPKYRLKWKIPIKPTPFSGIGLISLAVNNKWIHATCSLRDRYIAIVTLCWWCNKDINRYNTHPTIP